MKARRHEPHYRSDGKTTGCGGQVKKKSSDSADQSRIWVVRWWYRKGNTGDLHVPRTQRAESHYRLDQPSLREVKTGTKAESQIKRILYGSSYD